MSFAFGPRPSQKSLNQSSMPPPPPMQLLLHLTALSLALAASLIGQTLEVADPASVGMSAERLARIDTVLESYIAAGNLPGTVTLVARHGKIVHFSAHGFRDIESNASMQTDTIFRIASQSKATISVGIMMLQEEGTLLIDQPLSDFLPEFAKTTVAVDNDSGGYDIVPAKRKITLRDLLMHASGYDYGQGLAKEKWAEAEIQGWYFAHRDEPIRETVRRMAALPAQSHPGEKWVYGYNTDILGAVIEVVSGQDLATFLHARIFEPLGMVDTQFYLTTAQAQRLATVYAKQDQHPLTTAPKLGTMASQGQYVDGPRKSFSGGAGLLSTARDYATFLQMLANGGEYNGHRILSRKTVELMTVDHLPDGVEFRKDSGLGFGLGFSVVLDIGASGIPSSIGQFGWGGAYHTKYWVDPAEGLVFAYFTQLRPADGLDDHNKLTALVYQAIID
jgi:CubicO group peptidase (beta-lactamase class C family)